MAHNSRIRLAGLWTPGSVIDPAEMEALDAAQYLSLHEGGGTWAITSNMLVGGQPGVGWRFTLPLTVDDLAGHVKNGRKLYIDSGGTLEVNGLVDVKSGGVQKIQPGGLVRVLGAFLNPGAIQIEAGGWLDIQSGGVAFIRASAGLALYGTQTVQSGGVLRVAPSGVIEIAGINGLVIKNGFNGKVEAGGSFDVFGTLACYAGSNVDFQTGFTAAGTASFTGYATISTTATMRILGVATLESDATLTVNGTSGHGAAVYVGTYGQIVFSGGRISGAARVGQQLLFETGLEIGGGNSHVDTGATVTMEAGSTLDVLGRVLLRSAQPASNANPGSNNILFGTNICKAWAVVTTDGVGGVTVDDGYNIGIPSLSGGSLILDLPFVRPMATGNFAVVCNTLPFAGGAYLGQVQVKSATGVSVSAFSALGAVVTTVNLATTAMTFMVLIFARQS